MKYKYDILCLCRYWCQFYAPFDNFKLDGTKYLNTVITVLFSPILLKRSQYFLVYHYFVPLLRESTPFAGKNATNRLTNVEQFVYWANLTVEISVTLCLFIPATDLMLTKKEGRINWNKKNTIYLPQYIFNIDSVMFPPVCVVYCL